jgi:hypothetical protein
MWPLDQMETLLASLIDIDAITKKHGFPEMTVNNKMQDAA